MDGALPSVVGGPGGSAGYRGTYEQWVMGRGWKGFAANVNDVEFVCAAGVSVVNIDGGFSAGYQAALICRARGPFVPRIVVRGRLRKFASLTMELKDHDSLAPLGIPRSHRSARSRPLTLCEGGGVLLVGFDEGDQVGQLLVGEVVEGWHDVCESFDNEFRGFGDGLDEVVVGSKVGAFAGSGVEAFPAGADDDIVADGVAGGTAEGCVEGFAVAGVTFWKHDRFGGECCDVGG